MRWYNRAHNSRPNKQLNGLYDYWAFWEISMVAEVTGQSRLFTLDRFHFLSFCIYILVSVVMRALPLQLYCFYLLILVPISFFSKVHFPLIFINHFFRMHLPLLNSRKYLSQYGREPKRKCICYTSF